MVVTERFVDKNAQPVTNAPRALQRLWAEQMKLLKDSRRAIAQGSRSTRAIDAEIRTLRCCIYQVQILQHGFSEHMKEQRAKLEQYMDEVVESLKEPFKPMEGFIDGEFTEM